MKYHILISTLILGLIYVPISNISAQGKFSGLVIRVKGQATLVRSGKSSKLKKNTLISEGDVIQTKAGSHVGLQFASGISSNIGPKSKVSIKQLVKTLKKRQIQMHVSKGSLTNRVKPGSGQVDMRVSSPTLIAAVRGTEFSVEANDKEETTVAVNNGEVEVSSETGKVKEQTLKAGEKIIADVQGARKAIMDEHDKQKFRILQELESLKKKQFEAFTNQVRRNEAMREHMKNSILNPE